jgi:hypothetical protein
MLAFFIDVIVMNEIKENIYDVNISWNKNITCMWILENDIISTIADDSDFS